MAARTLIETSSARARSLLAPVALALTVMLSVVIPATACASAQQAASPSPTATRGVATGSVDDWQHEWEVLRLVKYLQDQVPPPAGPMVFDLGDSITRESITKDSGARSWTQQLDARAARAQKVLPRAWTLAGHNQTYGMDEQLVAGIPKTPAGQPKGIVLIGVGISRFIGPPLKETPPQLTPAKPGVQPGLSAWQRHVYDGRSPLPLTRKKELVPRWMQRRWTPFRNNLGANFAAITRIIKLCKARGLRPVLLDQPLDMKIVGHGLDRPRNAIRSRCNALVKKYGAAYGVRYIHFTGSIAIPTKEYWDMHHLFDPGARIWQSRLSDELVKILPKQTL